MSGDNLGLGDTEPMGGGEPFPRRANAPAGTAASGESLPLDESYTAPLPPEYLQRPLPAKVPKPPRQGANPGVVALSVVLVLAVIGGSLYFVVRNGARSTPPPPACGPSGACAVATEYLNAYAGFNFEGMYALTSQASRTHFSDASILANNVYTTAHAYIVGRSQDILSAMKVTSIEATPSTATQNSDGSFTVPVHVVLESSLSGAIAQDIAIPVVKEGSAWRVTWSPGLILSHLDDANDPLYSWHVVATPEVGKRGAIYDRDGNVLAEDGMLREIDAAPSKMNDAAVQALGAALGLPVAQIQATLAGTSGDTPVRIWMLPDDQYAGVSAALGAIAGVSAKDPVPGRVYPYGADLAPVTGYVSVVTPDDIKNDPTHYYTGTEQEVGHAGVEEWAEQYLRPIKGGRIDIDRLNADGTADTAHPVYFVGERPGGDGMDVHTTISLKLQQAAMASLRSTAAGYAGGSFAVDPSTGEVLVMASNPTYNPNDFADSLKGIPSSLHPQLNCALQCTDPTGSIFKIVTLAAGLQNGINTSFTCTGTYQVPGEDHLRIDDKAGGHGALTPDPALGQSCDVYFWNMAVELNVKDPTLLPNAAKAFGYGAPTGVIGVPAGGESAGVVPDPQWLQQNENAGWSPSDAANLGIGQGFFTATPAQVAMVSAALADNGVRMQPRLVSNVETASGTVVQAYPAKQIGALPLSADQLLTMQGAMLGSTSDPAGTSYDTFKDVPILIGGKTGSAESGQPRPHAWFTAYAPASPVSGPVVQAKIAIGTLVEYSSFGDTYAAPVVKAVLKAEFGF
jgi:penicillin-binding protein 2